MRSLRVLWASGFLALSALASVQCSAEPYGTLRLGLYVNDLLIPEETNLMALYMAESDAAGRTTKVHAFEATPLREGDRTLVPFPASLVVVSGEVTERVHLKLVAYHVGADGSRTVLTMREARTRVPATDARLLRLGLFWHGIGNVQDEGRGVVASGNVTTEARFMQLHSVCNGALAPAGQTADEAGRCTSVDVETEADAINAPLPGSTADDPCLDVAATFAGELTLADPATRTELAAGACSMQVPASVAATTFNVGVRSGAEVRALALGLGVQREGDRVRLPAMVCTALSRGAALVFSPSADPWTGAFGVCAPWNTATGATTRGTPSVDGGPSVDAPPTETGTDGTADASLEADAPFVEPTASRYLFTTDIDFQALDGIAATFDQVVLTMRDAEARVAREVVFALPVGTIPLDAPASGDSIARRPRVLDLAGKHEFYLEADGYPAQHLNPSGTAAPLSIPSPDNARVFQLAFGRGAVIHDVPAAARELDPAAPSQVLGSELLQNPIPKGVQHIVRFGSRAVGSLIEDDQTFDFLDCDLAAGTLANCSVTQNVDLPSIGGIGSTLDMTSSSLGVFALVEGDGTRALVKLGAPGQIATRSVDTSAAQLAAGPSHACFTGGDLAAAHVYCASSMTEGEPLVEVFDVAVRDVVLAADETYLYMAHRCGGALDIHLTRLPWAEAVAGGQSAECPPP